MIPSIWQENVATSTKRLSAKANTEYYMHTISPNFNVQVQKCVVCICKYNFYQYIYKYVCTKSGYRCSIFNCKFNLKFVSLFNPRWNLWSLLFWRTFWPCYARHTHKRTLEKFQRRQRPGVLTIHGGVDAYGRLEGQYLLAKSTFQRKVSYVQRSVKVNGHFRF